MFIRYIRLLELAISIYVLVAIIKKRLKIDVSFYNNSTNSEPHHLQANLIKSIC